jgi:hypothetical protein
MSLKSELEELALALEREIPLSQSREMYVRSLANARHARRLASSLPDDSSEPECTAGSQLVR